MQTVHPYMRPRVSIRNGLWLNEVSQGNGIKFFYSSSCLTCLVVKTPDFYVFTKKGQSCMEVVCDSHQHFLLIIRIT